MRDHRAHTHGRAAAWVLVAWVLITGRAVYGCRPAAIPDYD